MKIAVVGEGISGLAVAFYLKDHAHITMFSKGKGASYAAAGMMHKFVGDTGHKSIYADEAFLASSDILQSLKNDFYKKTPIIRKILNPEMKEGFLNYLQNDLEFLDEEHVLIKDGFLIDVPVYLHRLKQYLQHHHVQFHQKWIDQSCVFEEFDYVIYCAGYGVKQLVPDLKMKYLKGQSLIYEPLFQHEMPLIAKGYLAPFSDKVVIGSTYERAFESEDPCYEKAMELLKEPLHLHFQPYHVHTPKDVVSGVRVAHPNFNHPKIIKKTEKLFVVTGLGSRGLLYHGFLGKILKDYLVNHHTSSVFIL